MQHVAIVGAGAGEGSGARLRSLDGLRGVAAFVVVVYHGFLIAQPHLQERLGVETVQPGGLHWWLNSTPLSFLISGEQAVLVFFLLSGIVLTLPVVKSTHFVWAGYYPRRVLRLYVPVLASVALAVALLLLVPHHALPRPAWQWSDNAQSFDLAGVITASALVNPRPAINGPLWSLTWEMAFSIALPVFVWIALAVRQWWLLALIASVALVDVGLETDLSPLKYLPVFLIGAIAAVNLPAITSAAERINMSRRHGLSWWAILAISILLVTGFKTAVTLALGPFEFVTHILQGLVIVGCMGVIFLAIGSPTAIRYLEAPTAQWLGRVSFSLYLIHVPLMVAIAFAAGWEFWWLAIIAGIPASLLLAAAFTRLVEQPAHRVARNVGRSFDALYERRQARKATHAPEIA